MLTRSHKATKVLETTNHTNHTNIRVIRAIRSSRRAPLSVALFFVSFVPLCETIILRRLLPPNLRKSVQSADRTILVRDHPEN
jgi:hypothetical protein